MTADPAQTRGEKKQAAIYAVSAAVQSIQSPDELFRSIHRCISDILPARNFYIALYDRQEELISFPYFVDEYDQPPRPRKVDRGLTEYVLRTGAPLLASPERFHELVRRGEVESLGEPSLDWLGVPLKVREQTLGVLVVQTYCEGIRYTEDDMQMLSFVSSQVAMAIDRAQKEESLRSSEAELRGLFSAMNDVVILFDADGRHLKIGPTNTSLLYRPSDELIGLTVHDVFPPDLARQMMGYIRKALASRGPVKGEYAMQVGGQEIWFDATITPAEEEKVLMVARDNTAQKKMEKALREAQENYKGIFEHAVMGIAKHTSDGKYVSVNPALARIYGYDSPEELLAATAHNGGRLPTEPGCDGDPVCALPFDHDVAGYEKQVKRKDGSTVWVSENVQTVRDVAGKILYCITTVEDVTARKQAEKELHLLANTITCARDCFILSGLDGKILFVNEAFQATYGYDDQELLGKDVALFLPPDAPPLLRQQMYSTTGDGWNGELLHRRRDGTDFPVELWISVVRGESGEPVAHVGVARDITDRVKAEETLRLDESRLETLLRLNQMTGASMQRITDFALEEGVRLTKSTTGYLAFVSEDETVLTMHAWSRSAMAECRVDTKPRVYPLKSTGLWGEPVRQRTPIIVNDYGAFNPLKRGLPTGHVVIKRHLGIPVFDGESIVAVAGVANKEDEYTNSDVRQLTLLMDGMWLMLQRQRSEDKIRKSLEEKEVLLKEIHHRVKNNLQIISSLLNLQTGQVKDRQLVEILRESQNRIRSMALIHERLYRSEDFSRVDFGQYVNGLVTYLVRSYTGDSRPFNLHVDVQNVSLGVDLAIPCGLIINELVSNCLKHAFAPGVPGDVSVVLRRHDGHFLLRVEDNGQGLPPDIDLKKVESLGLQLVETLSTQIGGSLEVTTAPGAGTAFCISFPAR